MVFRGNEAIQKIKVTLFAVATAGESLADGTSVIFNNAYKKECDNDDVEKMDNFDEEIAIAVKNKKLAVEARPALTGNDTIFFHLSNFKQKDYKLKLEAYNLQSVIDAKLEDSYTKASTPIDLSTSTTYSFSVTADAASKVMNRFRLVFKSKPSVPIVIVKETKMVIYPNPATNKVKLQFDKKMLGRARIDISNAAGVIVHRITVATNSDQIQLSTEKLSSGTYVVKMIYDNEEYQQKLVIVK
jgi:hypothetical protein